ncbi:endolytic transglycosylase MltG [Demequina sp. NBRC 110055]|uniref:endolytic transglycosylase MltG n=1 Tax=Demequina sp. NBRC 110055 TaxID=1570344 RepID=UPI001185778A|nr:endolytic transglycosylase MltG [Demequina sp. NBRC 110055]
MTDLFEAESTTTTSLDLRRLQRQKRRAARRKWTAIISVVAVVLLAIGMSVAYNFVSSFGGGGGDDSVADFEGAGQGVVQVVIEPGDSGYDIAQTLYEAGVVASTDAFIQEANSRPDEAQSITPGYYFMQKEMKAEYAMDALLDPANRDELKITIPEGYRVDYYLQSIANLTEYSLEDVEAIAEDTDALGLPEVADGNLEGWLFPSTYTFTPDVQPAEVLSTMIAQTVKTLDKYDVAEEDRQEIVTVASLIEKEAKLDEDRPMIAGVIYNRLEIDMPLQLDATIKYLSPSEGAFTTTEEREIDSPYNTYMYAGLPPGPIANPGEASIEAAVNPAEHDYLYYVTVNLNTGETVYAETYDEHLKNVDQLQAWIAENDSSSSDEE